jgi:transposase
VGTSPWIVSDELWEHLEPLLPQRERRFRYPRRKPLSDREVLCGILYVLHTGIQCECLPQDLGFGSDMTCWWRLRHWNEAGVRQQLHEVLLAELNSLPAGPVPLRGRLFPRQGAKRGQHTGPSPVDRGRPARSTT